MKKIISVLCLVCFFPLFISAEIPQDVVKAFKNAGLPILEQGIAPDDFSLPLLNGRIQRLGALKGKVVFLNFWATWCPPCRSEMPSMNTLYQRFKGQGLEILAVDCAEDKQDVDYFMTRNKLDFSALLDVSGDVSDIYGIEAIPTTYIIDKEGMIISRVVGSRNWNDPKVFAAFEALLKN
jgi:thiol-disulfide isomerase/thioredoxin